MFDINPETHRHYLSNLERQIQPRSRPFRDGTKRAALHERVWNAPAALAFAAFILGGVAGGTLL